MTDIEVLLERAQELKGRENGIRWELAEVAWQIVGQRIPGATRQLADVCGLTSVDAPEHWAKAYRLYRVILHIAGDDYISDVTGESHGFSFLCDVGLGTQAQIKYKR